MKRPTSALTNCFPRPSPLFTIGFPDNPGFRKLCPQARTLAHLRAPLLLPGGAALRATAGDARAVRRRCPPDTSRMPRRDGLCRARWRRLLYCARFRGCWPRPGSRAAVSVSRPIRLPAYSHPALTRVWNLRRRSRLRPTCSDLHRPRSGPRSPLCAIGRRPSSKPPALLRVDFVSFCPRLYKHAQETTNREVLPGLPLTLPLPRL